MDDQLITLYDDKNFRALMNGHKSLYNFEDVTNWEGRAQKEIDRIINVIESLEADILNQRKELERENDLQAQKSFIPRIFTKNEYSRAIDQLIQKLRDNKENLSEMVSQLEEAIAFTPNSVEEQMNLAEEFRQRKRELLEKQEVASTVKAVQKGTHAVVNANSFGTFDDSKRDKAQRRQIRYAKEALLEPHESAKEAIDRQLLKTDHDILWAAKFTK